MTLAEIVAEVLSHQFSAAQYNDYAINKINEGQGYITAQTDFREFFTSATTALPAGTEDLTLPSDFSRLYSVVALQSNSEGNQTLTPITLHYTGNLIDLSTLLPKERDNVVRAPERAVENVLGSVDGLKVFESLRSACQATRTAGVG